MHDECISLPKTISKIEQIIDSIEFFLTEISIKPLYLWICFFGLRYMFWKVRFQHQIVGKVLVTFLDINHFLSRKWLFGLCCNKHSLWFHFGQEPFLSILSFQFFWFFEFLSLFCEWSQWLFGQTFIEFGSGNGMMVFFRTRTSFRPLPFPTVKSQQIVE